uniref:glycosyltransferase family 32 protein n=1 Tax=Aestuariivirga sp. TaxID=2650926 RepID=UPI003593BC38
RFRSAARYLRRARRAWPWHAGLFRAHLGSLAEIGAVDELRDIIRREERVQDGSAPAFVIGAASVLQHIGDFDLARAIAARIAAPQQRSSLDRALLSSLLRRGDTGAAETLFAEVGKWLPQRSVSHFGSGVDGAVRIDTRLAQRAAGAADPRILMPAAGEVVRRWIETHRDGGSGASSAVPQQVMQYWDKPEPPDDIAGLIASWRDQPGAAHHRFDRRMATDWLGTRLGADWPRALRAARSPAEESDFYRLAWLMLEGGLYVDCDDRRTGDLEAVFKRLRGLTVFLEPQGSIANNVIFAPPKHPAIVWAAHAAKAALLERHSDNTWMKTGPGLMTRAVAWYLTVGPDSAPDLCILPRYWLGSWMQVHVPLPYKRTNRYWNASAAGAGAAADLASFARRLLEETAPAP